MAPADFKSNQALLLLLNVLIFSLPNIVTFCQHLTWLMSSVLSFRFRSRRAVVWKTDVVLNPNLIIQSRVLIFLIYHVLLTE